MHATQVAVLAAVRATVRQEISGLASAVEELLATTKALEETSSTIDSRLTPLEAAVTTLQESLPSVDCPLRPPGLAQQAQAQPQLRPHAASSAASAAADQFGSMGFFGRLPIRSLCLDPIRKKSKFRSLKGSCGPRRQSRMFWPPGPEGLSKRQASTRGKSLTRSPLTLGSRVECRHYS
jgi:hypothetical protein